MKKTGFVDNGLHGKKTVEKNIFFRLKKFIKAKPGFFAALIIVLVMSIIILVYVVQPNDSPEKALQAKQIYSQNQAMFEQYLTTVEEQMLEEPENTLDDDYLASIKDDYLWLKNKETYLYTTKPNTMIYAKEAAFTLFADIIMGINDYMGFEVGEPNYTEKINAALALEIKKPELATTKELDEGFALQYEKDAFKQTAEELFNEYILIKKELINNAGTIERKYVEAKKILGLAYYDFNAEYWAE
jgi:hypothetical protein